MQDSSNKQQSASSNQQSAKSLVGENPAQTITVILYRIEQGQPDLGDLKIRFRKILSMTGKCKKCLSSVLKSSVTQLTLVSWSQPNSEALKLRNPKQHFSTKKSTSRCPPLLSKYWFNTAAAEDTSASMFHSKKR